eukprot:scaffold6686_cov63-Attheya_sp.AAC.3
MHGKILSYCDAYPTIESKTKIRTSGSNHVKGKHFGTRLEIILFLLKRSTLLRRRRSRERRCDRRRERDTDAVGSAVDQPGVVAIAIAVAVAVAIVVARMIRTVDGFTSLDLIRWYTPCCSSVVLWMMMLCHVTEGVSPRHSLPFVVSSTVQYVSCSLLLVTRQHAMSSRYSIFLHCVPSD